MTIFYSSKIICLIIFTHHYEKLLLCSSVLDQDSYENRNNTDAKAEPDFSQKITLR